MIHYSGRVGKGYPVQKPYVKPKAKKRPEDYWVRPEEIRARDYERKKARFARAQEEMQKDPNSKYHGMRSYVERCKCKCAKCEQTRKELRDERNAKRQIKKLRGE